MLDGQDGGQAAVADWRGHLTDELKADPIVSSWAEKASEKDIPSILKGYAHAQKRMGSAINLPGENAKPEEITALRQKLYGAKVFEAPPGKPEEYGLADPGNLPEGIKFSPELAGKFATVLHKHGIPKSAVAELMPVYLEAIQGHASTLKVDAGKAMETLKAEHGEKFDERWELADRLAKDIFKSQEEIDYFAKGGFGPLFYGPLLRLAHLAGQDSSYIESLPSKGGTISAEDARSEYAKVMNDPKHPHYEGFRRRDPKAEEYVNDLYRRAAGTEKVTFGQGISV